MPLIGRDNVKKMIRENKKKRNQDIRGVYFAGLTNVVEGTPVDEGRARNNWFLSVGVPFSLSGRTESASGGGSTRSLNSMPEYVLNKKIFYTNNLPYIGALEYGGFPNPVERGTYNKKTKSYEKRSGGGFSKQAPSGWVRATLIKMANKIRSL